MREALRLITEMSYLSCTDKGSYDYLLQRAI